MKKHKVKKLQLSRETLRELESADAQKVGGGISLEAGSCMSGGCTSCVWTRDDC
ncbi:MAG TPA: hypothetical protein VJ725_32320 [Thermoanaerobaculia bacterium]|nr:hypothetical protein [Thermoanaerobaculia bacterium]